MARFRLVVPILALMLVFAACTSNNGGGGTTGPSASGSGGGTANVPAGDGEIEVTSLWGGAEADAFQKVLDAFTAKTDIKVTYTSVRQDYATVLNNRLAQNDPPDIAIIPGIGFLRSFARDQLLIPFDQLGINKADIEGNYAPGILDIGTVNDQLVAVMVKFNSKSTIWYDPSRFSDGGWDVPDSWDNLVKLTNDIKSAGETPWGLGAGDSWTLTDWFESIYLRQAGPDAYDKLFSADGDWTDQTVKDAIKSMTDLLTNDNVAGGIDGALATNFVDGIGLVFSDSPKAEMYYEGGFVGGIATQQVNKNLKIGETIDFFDFPPIGGEAGQITIGGDVIGAFVKDSDVAEFVKYMTTPEAGQVWAEQGTIISPVKGVDTSVYPNDLAKKEAEQAANASVVKFDGSDLLPAGTDLGAVLQQALQNPDQVDTQLEQFQSEVDSAWQEEQSGGS